MFGGSGGPSGGRWWRRGDVRQAIGVATLTLSVVGLTAWVDGATARPVTTTTPGQVLTLTSEGTDRSVQFVPPPGWHELATGSPDTAELRDGSTTVTLQLKGKIDDLAGFADRSAREFTLQTDGVQVARSGAVHTAGGFTGSRSVAVADRRQGEFLVLGKDSVAVTVLSLSDPAELSGRAADLRALTDSLRWGR